MTRRMRAAAGCVVVAALLVGGQAPSIAGDGGSGQRLQGAGEQRARTLAVVDMLGRPKDEQLMFAALQGIVNRDSSM